MNKQLNPIGSSKKDTSLLVKSDVRFSDVIGHDEILEDIKFISRLIKNPKLGDEIGAKLPKPLHCFAKASMFTSSDTEYLSK